MYLDRIKVERFGPIGQLCLKFRPQGLNIVLGQNAAGKTQLLAAVHALFYGDHTICYRSESDKNGSVSLRLILPQGALLLENRYTGRSSALCAENFSAMAAASQIDLGKLFFYFPDIYGGQGRSYSKETIRQCSRFLWDLGLKGHHILGTCLAKKEVNVVMTAAEERYLELVCLLSQFPPGSVFFCDSPFSSLDPLTIRMLLAVFQSLPGRQFILTEHPARRGDLAVSDASFFNLPDLVCQDSPVAYNYRPISLEPPGQDPDGSSRDAVTPALFCLDRFFPYEECEGSSSRRCAG
ncbi:MAG: AAA family ATPase [Oscillospiraceae bacterium]|nr:AAA family ATPase [Oscillospiraceae bacterium]